MIVLYTHDAMDEFCYSIRHELCDIINNRQNVFKHTNTQWQKQCAHLEVFLVKCSRMTEMECVWWPLQEHVMCVLSLFYGLIVLISLLCLLCMGSFFFDSFRRCCYSRFSVLCLRDDYSNVICVQSPSFNIMKYYIHLNPSAMVCIYFSFFLAFFQTDTIRILLFVHYGALSTIELYD